MNWPLIVFIAHAASTFYLIGLIWTIQIVHYPLFNGVGEAGYVRYQERHQNRITSIVGPVMLVELCSSVWLIWLPFRGVDSVLAIVGVGLVALIWSSTAFIQVPCHARLSQGFNLPAYQKLVYSNWIRTLAWSARGAIVCTMLASALTDSKVGNAI